MLQYTAFWLLGLVITTEPQIDVVYPRPTKTDSIARINQVERNFIFGSVKPSDAVLTINNQRIIPYSNGAFLAYLPVDWENETYRLTAIYENDTTRLTVPFSNKPEAETPIPPDVDFPVFLTLNGRVARTYPQGAYYLFPAAGTKAVSTEWSDGYYRLPLTNEHSVWISDYYVLEHEPVLNLEPSIVWKVHVNPGMDWEEMILPVCRRVLYRTKDENEPNRIVVELYGVISHIDRISYPNGVESIKEIIWDQPDDNLLRLDVRLNHQPCGYKAIWKDDQFILRVRKSTRLNNGIKSLHIVIDPGHGGNEFGAIGPVGVTEKDVNLWIAKPLARLLERRGAKVTLTRTKDIKVGLKERIRIAEKLNADLLISLHHNALPDGVNPFEAFGTGTHYYHPQSRDLALSIQREVVRELRLPDEGIYYHNLALARPTSMPAVLLEAAYMMLPEQETMMLEKDYPDRLAKAVYRGIKRFVSDWKRSFWFRF